MEPKESEVKKTKLQQRQDVALRQLVVHESSSLLHKNIRESGIRERTKGIIVGIERGGMRMLNPDSSMVFELGDIIWIVGNIRRLQVVLNEEMTSA